VAANLAVKLFVDSFAVTVWLFITVGAILIVRGIAAARRAAGDDEARTLGAAARLTTLCIATWIALATYFCWTTNLGFPEQQKMFLPWDVVRYSYMAVIVYTPSAAYVMARRRLPSFDRLCRLLSLPLVIRSQFYRVVGVYFMVLALKGEFPRVIGIPVGLSAFVVGLTAVPVANGCERYGVGARRWVCAWNWLGLAYFNYAVWSVIASISPLLELEPAATAVFFYPLSYIVSFGLPFSMILHLLVQSRLNETTPN
jgi:hypothetical protein